MQPLSVKTSKTTAKVSIAIIWILGIGLASPMAVFHKFSYVYDEQGNGVKPFCSPLDLDTDVSYVPSSASEVHGKRLFCLQTKIACVLLLLFRQCFLYFFHEK